jgi:N-acetylmuramoyl-L-alanine amidase
MKTEPLIMRIKILLLLITSFAYSDLSSQTIKDTVFAKNGDGIFSLLRNAGIHPIKYYEDFLNLNEKIIRNGSDLIVGETYILPNAPDSFRNMGTRILVDTGIEEPIFSTELPKMKIKDSTLNHTVYYVMNTPETIISNNSTALMLALAKELMVRGARVFLLQDKIEQQELKDEKEKMARNKLIYGEYSSVVNKKYLTYNGSYQRVLVIEDAIANGRNVEVSLHHYGNSDEDTRLAESLNSIFLKNTGKRTNSSLAIYPMRDQANIYLAKNILPAVTIIGLHNKANIKEPGILLKSNKTSLTKMITSGILKDYSNKQVGSK